MKPKLFNGIAGIVAVILWLGIFLLGLMINSQPYRDKVGAGSWDFFDIWMVFVTYTVTNVAILCCLAGIIGSTSNLFLILKKKAKNGEYPDGEYNTSNPIFAGILRGFLIYILFLAGVYAGASDPFAMTTAEQYARMAGTVTLLSFIISFEPSFLRSIIGIASKKYTASGN